jgi:AcrR family transcriptional regulator
MSTRDHARALTPKGAATRQRIIVGTSARIREQGISATTLDDVCEATKTSKGQLFHYFPDGREQLLLAVAEFEADQLLVDQQPFLSDLSSWAAWRGWRDALIERYRRQGVHCPLGVLMTELGRTGPGSRAITAQLLARWEDALVSGIVSMQHALLIASDIDAKRVAAAVIAAVQGGVVIHLSTGSTAHLEAGLDTWIEFLQASGQPSSVAAPDRRLGGHQSQRATDQAVYS